MSEGVTEESGGLEIGVINGAVRIKLVSDYVTEEYPNGFWVTFDVSPESAREIALKLTWNSMKAEGVG